MLTLVKTDGLDKVAVAVSSHDQLVTHVGPLAPSIHHTIFPDPIEREKEKYTLFRTGYPSMGDPAMKEGRS